MSSVNHDLARQAAERIYDLRDKMCEDLPHEFAEIISDTYAAPLAELERLKRQVAFVTELAMHALGDVDSIDLYYDRGSYRTWLEFEDDGAFSNFKIKDCPNSEVTT